MEGIFPRNAILKIIIRASSTRTICKLVLIEKNENQLEDAKSGYSRTIISTGRRTFRPITLCVRKDVTLQFFTLIANIFVIVVLVLNYISMLKRSLSMEFDSNQYKSSVMQPRSEDTEPVNPDDENQSNKKHCHSPERGSGYEDGLETWSKPRKVDSFGRFPQNAENAHVTQSRSIFSHENSCVYGNPKEDIKNIETAPETAKEVSPFDGSSANALDLSCKSVKSEEEKPDGNTYQYHKNSENPRSNLQIKLVSPTLKKPSIPEQLQIAKIQQQQRRSIQQQQKLIQQMRRSLDPTGKSRPHHSNNTDSSPGSHKSVKYFGNSTPNQEDNIQEYQGRMKEEYPPLPGSHFPQYPYFEPGQHKELPDGHPILPLLDPVYFSALYNAHGFLPPSSPSIAAAFIGTLQDALPKLPLMFPSTSSNNSSILPQKSNDNHN